MLQRFFAAGLIALAVGVASAAPHAAARPNSNSTEDTYEMWSDCHSLPVAPNFLPIYLGSDSPGFVDLDRTEFIGPLEYRALQYTRDRDFGEVPIRAGHWYGGMGAERWPVGTINPARLFEHFRVTAWVIDGNLYPVDPSCVVAFETDELSVGVYNVWVRFTEPGVHTLKIIGKQIAPFPFTDPLLATRGIDPFGLDGRRVFVAREVVGDVLDGQFVHSYELHVDREQ